MLTAVTVLFSACHDKTMRQYSLNAHMEQLNAGNSKVALYHEQWTYWEYDDEILIASDMSSAGDHQDAYLSGGAGGDYANYDGVFIAPLPDGSKYFAGVHPYSTYHTITPAGPGNNSFTIKTYLKPTQGYRNDSTYAKQVLPMVAVFNGEWDAAHPDPYRLDFHSLAGIVRLQLVNGTSDETRIITGITLTTAADSPWKALCGLFNVNNPATNNPTLDKDTKAVAAAGEDTTKLTLGMPSGGMEFAPDSLRSFYVVLPSRHGMDAATSYKLQMAVTTTNTSGGDEKTFTKTFTVDIRRNGITYMRAINVTDFGTGSANQPVLVGNGTEWRPFKIYTIADLQYVRDQFASPRTDGYVYINGQKVTADTWFRIMRSDIRMGSTNWTSGIENFTGHMTYYANVANYENNAYVTGIVNNSTYALFSSIGTEGVVQGLAIRCDSVIYRAGMTSYSPFCTNNYGKIIDCHVGKQTGVNNLIFTCDMAGICVTNHAGGLIQGCGSSLIGEANYATNSFAGICLTNSGGTIRGCYASSPMDITVSRRAAGICMNNSGTVCDSYFAASINHDNQSWGGIVYENTGSGLVENCYIGATATLITDTVGGIVCLNSGTVNYCWADAAMQGHKVGGIVATVNNGGNVKNCFINDSSLVVTIRTTGGTRHIGGALVAEVLAGGHVNNSYVVIDHIGHPTSSTFGGLVGRVASGGTVSNCYVSMSRGVWTPYFYGESAGTLTSCYLIGNSQANVTLIHPNNDYSGDLNDLTEMHNALNANRGAYAAWQRIVYNPAISDYNDKITSYLAPYSGAKTPKR